VKRLQLLWGGLIVIGFLLTGVYMQSVIDPQSELSMARMSFRANHIYLLMSGLVVIVWAQRTLAHERSICLWMSRIAGLLIVVAPVFFLIAFGREAGVANSERMWTLCGVIVLFAGVMLSFLVATIEFLVGNNRNS